MREVKGSRSDGGKRGCGVGGGPHDPLLGRQEQRQGLPLPQLRPDGGPLRDQDGRALLCEGGGGQQVRHELPTPGEDHCAQEDLFCF